MRYRLGVVTSLCMASALAQTVYSQTTDRKSFEAKLFAMQTMNHFTVSDEKFAGLTDTQKTSLIDARNDLMDMLDSIEHRRDIKKYVAPDLIAKYKTSTSLAASFIDSETSIVAAGISDFSYVEPKTIKLHFFAVVSAEGDIVVSEKTAVLKEFDSMWRVTRFE